jgi:hypothetical protein
MRGGARRAGAGAGSGAAVPVEDEVARAGELRGGGPTNPSRTTLPLRLLASASMHTEVSLAGGVAPMPQHTEEEGQGEGQADVTPLEAAVEAEETRLHQVVIIILVAEVASMAL